MKKLFKEPLVYYFVLGLVVFGLHSFLNSESRGQEDTALTVEVTSADIEWIRSAWQARMKRQPTQQELEGLIDSFIRDQILYREAMAMDLDERDLVIQKRLVQKLTYVFEDIAETVEPTEEELQKYMQQNREKYRVPGTVTFTQVYFNPQKRDNPARDAAAVLAQLRSTDGSLEDAFSQSDTIMIETAFDKKYAEDVARVFGHTFAGELFSIEDKGWQGPIQSSYGLHLVYISDRVESSLPAFDVVREDVKDDFVYNHKNNVVDGAYNAVKSRYTILVEGLPYE
ncbi:MAG: peptidyl-prolyl cis-trans isomerase [Planctomycetota bacterium]